VSADISEGNKIWQLHVVCSISQCKRQMVQKRPV